ncbi:hypothetical protein M0812_20535 [Anaeramoeba flamelloides]|uniref:C2 NT-type domain-containing protein n=1 Tax=Anaeramoeba flamelloides TaxID=1746091 RepID=A0AAV7YSG2_9EUKA|nr:hypothetical protein M0812_20535 [Anaeramoeba flamelloides]
MSDVSEKQKNLKKKLRFAFVSVYDLFVKDKLVFLKYKRGSNNGTTRKVYPNEIYIARFDEERTINCNFSEKQNTKKKFLRISLKIVDQNPNNKNRKQEITIGRLFIDLSKYLQQKKPILQLFKFNLANSKTINKNLTDNNYNTKNTPLLKNKKSNTKEKEQEQEQKQKKEQEIQIEKEKENVKKIPKEDHYQEFSDFSDYNLFSDSDPDIDSDNGLLIDKNYFQMLFPQKKQKGLLSQNKKKKIYWKNNPNKYKNKNPNLVQNKKKKQNKKRTSNKYDNEETIKIRKRIGLKKKEIEKNTKELIVTLKKKRKIRLLVNQYHQKMKKIQSSKERIRKNRLIIQHKLKRARVKYQDSKRRIEDPLHIWKVLIEKKKDEKEKMKNEIEKMKNQMEKKNNEMEKMENEMEKTHSYEPINFDNLLNNLKNKKEEHTEERNTKEEHNKEKNIPELEGGHSNKIKSCNQLSDKKDEGEKKNFKNCQQITELRKKFENKKNSLSVIFNDNQLKKKELIEIFSQTIVISEEMKQFKAFENKFEIEIEKIKELKTKIKLKINLNINKLIELNVFKKENQNIKDQLKMKSITDENEKQIKEIKSTIIELKKKGTI